MKFNTIYEIKDWQGNANELKITPIYDDETNKEIQIILPKDKIMKEHSANGVIVVQVLKGEIDFSVESKVINLKELMSIKLASGIKHSLLAKQDSIIRLSLAKSDSFARVKNVEII
ncbi:Cupin domain-containing protein [Campylobacter sp. RM5004]|uniref:cupin domain-containing protein n=1 Tax=Campylobacter sp. RM5004 TaxID=1660078 RepID=UPI001EFA7D56|nr:cupin domain-containing protein [Campylobacter sp. RM5004]ULO01006.1 Cupin domain-containing protein [Campylobacter sp. RM5004]